MAKKQSSRKDSSPQGPVAAVIIGPYTVGRYLSAHRHERAEYLFTREEIFALKNVRSGPDPSNSFERWIAIIRVESWARRTLKAAGLPADPRFFVSYTLPEGEALPQTTLLIPAQPVPLSRMVTYAPGFSPGQTGNLMAVVKARGFREGKDMEWYAAEILRLIWLIRTFIRMGKTDWSATYAIDLGALFVGGNIFNILKAQRQNAGAKPKHNPIVKRFVESRLRKDPSIKSAALWRSIPQDECEAVSVGKAKLFIGNDDCLHLIGKVEGFLDPRPIGRPLRFTSFRNYVTAAKKSLPR